MLPLEMTFGTLAVSTTLIHGLYFVNEKYLAAESIPSSVRPFAKSIELPANPARSELRDPTSGFIAYVPSASLK